MVLDVTEKARLLDDDRGEYGVHAARRWCLRLTTDRQMIDDLIVATAAIHDVEGEERVRREAVIELIAEAMQTRHEGTDMTDTFQLTMDMVEVALVSMGDEKDQARTRLAEAFRAGLVAPMATD